MNGGHGSQAGTVGAGDASPVAAGSHGQVCR